MSFIHFYSVKTSYSTFCNDVILLLIEAETQCSIIVTISNLIITGQVHKGILFVIYNLGFNSCFT